MRAKRPLLKRHTEKRIVGKDRAKVLVKGNGPSRRESAESAYEAGRKAAWFKADVRRSVRDEFPEELRGYFDAGAKGDPFTMGL